MPSTDNPSLHTSMHWGAKKLLQPSLCKLQSYAIYERHELRPSADINSPKTSVEINSADSTVRMACYHDLSHFQRGVILGAREMGDSLPEIDAKLGFSRTTISWLHREYKNSGKSPNLRSDVAVERPWMNMTDVGW